LTNYSNVKLKHNKNNDNIRTYIPIIESSEELIKHVNEVINLAADQSFYKFLSPTSKRVELFYFSKMVAKYPKKLLSDSLFHGDTISDLKYLVETYNLKISYSNVASSLKIHEFMYEPTTDDYLQFKDTYFSNGRDFEDDDYYYISKNDYANFSYLMLNYKGDPTFILKEFLKYSNQYLLEIFFNFCSEHNIDLDIPKKYIKTFIYYSLIGRFRIHNKNNKITFSKTQRNNNFKQIESNEFTPGSLMTEKIFLKYFSTKYVGSIESFEIVLSIIKNYSNETKYLFLDAHLYGSFDNKETYNLICNNENYDFYFAYEKFIKSNYKPINDFHDKEKTACDNVGKYTLSQHLKFYHLFAFSKTIKKSKTNFYSNTIRSLTTEEKMVIFKQSEKFRLENGEQLQLKEELKQLKIKEKELINKIK
jgi:hypothetical protein